MHLGTRWRESWLASLLLLGSPWLGVACGNVDSQDELAGAGGGLDTGAGGKRHANAGGQTSGGTRQEQAGPGAGAGDSSAGAAGVQEVGATNNPLLATCQAKQLAQGLIILAGTTISGNLGDSCSN